MASQLWQGELPKQKSGEGLRQKNRLGVVCQCEVSVVVCIDSACK